MEAIEEPAAPSVVESVKVNIANEESMLLAEDVCRTSNGVAESTSMVDAGDAVYSVGNVGINMDTYDAAQLPPNDELSVSSTKDAAVPDNSAALPLDEDLLSAMESNAAVESLLNETKSSEVIEEGIADTPEAIMCNEVTIEGSPVVDSTETSIDTVTLRTEILVEKSDNDCVPDPKDIKDDVQNNANSILSDLGQGIELSEALRSSDTTDNVDNNNGTDREEVFNKEELLDILEGNDESAHSNEVVDMLQTDAKTKKTIEAQIAMEQLSRLKRTKKSDRTPRKRKVKTENKDSENVQVNRDNEKPAEVSNEPGVVSESEVLNSNHSEKKDSDSIVNVLVKDWDDDEPPEADQSNQSLEDTESVAKTTDNLVKSQESESNEVSAQTSTEVSGEGQVATQSKSGDESQPQRRLGRVIKKKVIFDPDNPDTFTKGKNVMKSKESNSEKEQPPIKKSKADSQQTPQRAKSKSPTSKLQWKKPTPKSNSKQNRRLTEVDKLLMDEGAVNMIYQLTPEAPKGKKNMRTKAEFIKKIQSSTPDGKEMKFRERKKEIKEENEAKKILGGKPRSSMSSSVKSPSACEDFETHSADDSIIYRRHSSSSYSSACMSPRRLSDVETAGAARPAAPPSGASNETFEESTDIFMPDSSNEIINKDDCLSIKEKLNTKLSLALNKRKKDSNKPHKPPKQRKSSKNVSVEREITVASENAEKAKHVSVQFDNRLAEICIENTGFTSNSDVLKELEQALLFVDERKDVSVTLITSECGTLCSELDLRPLLCDNMEIRTNYAHEIAEAVRSLLCSVEKHSKLLVSCVWGECAGVGLALMATSDVALASEHSTFTLSTSLPLPGVATLTSRCTRLSPSLINDLVLFDRRLSATEALQGGLLSRTLPGTYSEQARVIAKDLAAPPTQNTLLKKQLLNLKKSNDSETTFLIGLQKERDLLVEYWTSVEGQDILRSTIKHD